MNLTVGPLPPAVYWRRRAIVLGAIVLLVVLLVATCSGSGSDAQGDGQTPAGDVSPASGSPAPTGSAVSPIVGNGAPPSGTASASPPPVAVAPPSASPTLPADFCTDDEMRITPSIKKITGGTVPYELSLRIRNISDRSCKRDVGAKEQEMHIVSNGKTIWSSDSCQADDPPPDVRTFGPNIEAMFTIGWDATQGTNCDNPSHPVAAGRYQLIARLGGKTSSPVDFTIHGK